MKVKIALLICLISIFLPSSGKSSDRGFQIKNISSKIFMVKIPEGGEDQLVITSSKGLVVFDSFWSEITARRHKEAIARALNRNDFYLTINMTDRLDMFGGNAAYKETTIIGHQAFWDKYQGKEKEVEAEIKRLIDMWRWKEDVSRQRLETHAPGSEDEISEKRWMNTCRQRADELEKGFSLLLPNVVYRDSMMLNLGDITLKLIWFGKAGYDGMTVAVVPAENIAIIPGFIMHSQHLAPYPHPQYAELDVPRWIEVLEEILEGDNPVDRIICDINNVWPRERALTHLHYIRSLWNSVVEAEEAGMGLAEIQDQLSLDKDFAFVKEMQEYKDGGDDWIRPQHEMHLRLFFLQQKNLASEIIKTEGRDSLPAALAKVRRLREEGRDIYFDEASINSIGYYLLNSGRVPEALEVFILNVEVFPESANVYDSLAEAYMKNGDTIKAINNYKKSLELNPHNENAQEKLKTLEGM
ncbi:MAG: tetratricopeptide repeat protein [Candidatus Krumholzibacteriota bacterium]|nr:tetratricopeptide repeat protein [Candidatus Krumholzibacteriota bacterium]